jgi:beta-lactamase regulating signal transducer with metallopeptidase domain
MRVAVLLAAMVLFACSPYVAGRRLLTRGGPRPTIVVSLLSLVGLSLGCLFLLIAVIDPAKVPTGAIPHIIERCAEAASNISAHPMNHWPQIAAAMILLAFLARLIIAAVITLSHSRRGLPTSRSEHPMPRVGDADVWASVKLIGDREPVAYTTGVFRRQIVVSTGLFDQMDAGEAHAVLAHEDAHIQGRHALLLFVGRTLSSAFGFLPPVRRAVDGLILGLEVAADEAACVAVGSPLVVARAIASFAELSRRASSATALGAAENELLFRVRRLADSSRKGQRHAPSRWGWVAVASMALLVSAQIVVLPASARALSTAAQSKEAHQVCHLPH